MVCLETTYVFLITSTFQRPMFARTGYFELTSPTQRSIVFNMRINMYKKPRRRNASSPLQVVRQRQSLEGD